MKGFVNLTHTNNKKIKDVEELANSKLSSKPDGVTSLINQNTGQIDEQYIPKGEVISGETDPTVPSYIKDITVKQINDWDKINDVESIAKGANQAVSFLNYNKMITKLNSIDNNVYRQGQNIMIVTLNVPDLWISGVTEEYIKYNYTTDQNLVDGIKQNGAVQIGNYWISLLETQKVDLTEYVKNTDIASTTKAGIVKVGQAINGIAIDEVGTIYLQPASTGNIDKKTSYQPITPGRLDYAIKVGLTTNTQVLTAEDKAKIKAWLGFATVDDITSAVGSVSELLGNTDDLEV